MSKTVCLCLLFAVGCITQGFLLRLRIPCALEPRFFNISTGEAADLTDINVPQRCQRGIFSWDYPTGHVILHFPNGLRLPMQVCFRDDLGGSVFTISDVTPGVNYTLDHFKWGSNTTVCTDISKATDIVLKIDAPEPLVHLGSMIYIVKI